MSINKYGTIIKTVRTEKGMSLEECAGRCLLTPGDLGLVEEGKMLLSNADVVIVANVLGISSVALGEGELIRKEELPRLEKLIERIEKRIEELKGNMYYMQEIVSEFAFDAGVDIVDLDVLEERLLNETEGYVKKGTDTVIDETENMSKEQEEVAEIEKEVGPSL